MIAECSKYGYQLKQSEDEKNELKKQNDKLQTDLTKFKEIAAKRLEAMNNLTIMAVGLYGKTLNESEEKKEVI